MRRSCKSLSKVSQEPLERDKKALARLANADLLNVVQLKCQKRSFKSSKLSLCIQERIDMLATLVCDEPSLSIKGTNVNFLAGAELQFCEVW